MVLAGKTSMMHENFVTIFTTYTPTTNLFGKAQRALATGLGLLN